MTFLSGWPRLVLVGLAFSFCSCVVQRQVAFNEADFRRAAGVGTGSVVGRCFVVMRDDSERPAANTTIDLGPVNAYTTEVIRTGGRLRIEGSRQRS